MREMIDDRNRLQGKTVRKIEIDRSSQANDSPDVQVATVRDSLLPGLAFGFEAPLAASSTV